MMEKLNPDELADLRGKVAFVTGASSGLGREFAIALSHHGCNVVIGARRLDLLKSLKDDIHMYEREDAEQNSSWHGWGKIAIVQLDVAKSEAEIDGAVEVAWRAFGKIDVLVNNAGVTTGSARSPLDHSEEDWNTLLTTNARGVFLVAKAVAKRMCATRQHGSIINISSISGIERGLLPGGVAYSASKVAVNQLTKAMALELGKYNIRVNAIAPGLFKSDITYQLIEKEWVHKVATKIVPLGHWGDTNPDLTSLVLLLASETAIYITGNIFVVDGGYTIPGIPVWSSL